jgi:lipid II:glycine glycyltransferase (peptidoglycan interpeptide bridge formation enzyme)
MLVTVTITNNEDNIEYKIPFYGQEKYLSSRSSNYGWFTSKNFLLPFIIKEISIFKQLVFTTATIYKNDATIEEERDFLDSVVSYIKINKMCDYIYKQQPTAIFNTYPKKANVIRWGSYQIDTNNDLDFMIKRLSKTQIRYTKKAIKEGLKVERSEDIEEIFQVCNQSLTRQNIQLEMNIEEFIQQYKNFHPSNMLIFKISYQEEIQGAIVIFFDKDYAYYEYGGSIPKPKNGSLKLLHLTVMQYLSEKLNIKKYDFVGAIPDVIDNIKETGIQKFKREFGAKMVEGYHFSVIINPFKHYLFHILLKLYFLKKGIKYEDPIDKTKKLSKSKLEIKL